MVGSFLFNFKQGGVAMLWIIDMNVISNREFNKCPLCGHDFYRVAEGPNTFKCHNCGLMAIDNYTDYNDEEELR